MSKKELTTKEILEKAGVPASNQRILIYNYMAQNGKDSEPKKMRDDLIEFCPTLSLTTIYNNIRCLSANGLLRNMKTTKEIKVCCIELNDILGYALLIGEEKIHLGNQYAAEFFENHYKQLGYQVKRNNW